MQEKICEEFLQVMGLEARQARPSKYPPVSLRGSKAGLISPGSYFDDNVAEVIEKSLADRRVSLEKIMFLRNEDTYKTRSSLITDGNKGFAANKKQVGLVQKENVPMVMSPLT
jgi:hypothetical protein